MFRREARRGVLSSPSRRHRLPKLSRRPLVRSFNSFPSPPQRFFRWSHQYPQASCRLRFTSYGRKPLKRHRSDFDRPSTDLYVLLIYVVPRRLNLHIFSDHTLPLSQPEPSSSSRRYVLILSLPRNYRSPLGHSTSLSPSLAPCPFRNQWHPRPHAGKCSSYFLSCMLPENILRTSLSRTLSLMSAPSDHEYFIEDLYVWSPC